MAYGLNQKQIDIVKSIAKNASSANIGAVSNWNPSHMGIKNDISERRVIIPTVDQNSDFYNVGTTIVQ